MATSEGAGTPSLLEGSESTRLDSSRSVELLRIGTGLVWWANLVFIVDPSNQYFASFGDTALSYGPTTLGGPGLAEFVAAHPAFFAWAIALSTVYLAVAFTAGLTTRLACCVGSIFSVVLFATQVGSTFTLPGGTDVGPHPLYLLAYGVLLVGGAGSTLSMDEWLAHWLARRRAAAARPQ